MKLGKLELELFYSNKAVKEIEAMCEDGEMKNLGKLFENKKISEEMTTLSELIAILANAAILKHNQEVTLGLSFDEKKKEMIDAELIETMMDVGDMNSYMHELLSVMGAGSKFEVPDNIKLAENDIDLEEIEKEKNPKGTTEDIGCA